MQNIEDKKKKKQKKNVFSIENIWSIQKKAVPLHAFSPCTREGD